jgi:hypothetical protein
MECHYFFGGGDVADDRYIHQHELAEVMIAAGHGPDAASTNSDTSCWSSFQDQQLVQQHEVLPT